MIPATWQTVLDQLQEEPPAPDNGFQRRADKFGVLFDLPSIPLNESTVTVQLEQWDAVDIRIMLYELARRLSLFITYKPPRHAGLPITVLERGPVRLLIDGRHRANLWIKTPGLYPVYVVRPK